MSSENKRFTNAQNRISVIATCTAAERGRCSIGPKTGLEPSTQISLGSETEFCMTKEKLARIVDDFGKDDVEKKDRALGAFKTRYADQANAYVEG